MATAAQTTAFGGRRPAFSLIDLLARGFSTLHVWRDRAVTRRQLATLDQRMLADIGLPAAEALREAHKPFWCA